MYLYTEIKTNGRLINAAVVANFIIIIIPFELLFTFSYVRPLSRQLRHLPSTRATEFSLGLYTEPNLN